MSSAPVLGRIPLARPRSEAGLADHVAALTINKVCGSGLKAVMLAAQGIATGDVDIVVAGGMESMSSSLSAPARARRAAHGERRTGGLDDPRRSVVRVRAVPYGQCRGNGRRELHSRPRRAGRIRRAQPPARRLRRQTPGVQGRDSADHDSAEEGRADRLRSGRGHSPRNDGRDTRRTEARLQDGRLGDGGQRARRERRRVGARGDGGRARAAPRPRRRWRVSSGRRRAACRRSSC